MHEKCVTRDTHGKAFNKAKCLHVKLLRVWVVMKIRLGLYSHFQYLLKKKSQFYAIFYEC